MATPGATPDQLRDDIDSGRTGDKVPGADPAAAPLGTDEEAAGTPLDPQTVERERPGMPESAARKDRTSHGMAWALWGFVGLVLLALAMMVFWAE